MPALSTIVYLGLGSNMGARRDYLKKARMLLKRRGIRILQESTIIETTPFGGPVQGTFLNQVLKTATCLPPQQLLKTVKTIEKDLGRVTVIPKGPRNIDIDILLYGNLRIHTPLLQIPHPLMHKRSFVMNPLKEICPQIKLQYL